MLKPQFKIKIDKQEDNYGRFIIEPLEQGYGDTLGTALRRCLLTSLEGLAIVEVRIEGVKHQFSTLQGLKEDIVEFILNLKKVRIKSDKLAKMDLSLEAKGSGEVKASKIRTPEGVEIVNKDLVLANLADKNSKLSVKMKVKKGLGYQDVQVDRVETVGAIPLDAAFTPVIRVRYKLETTRVGKRTDFSKLILEIWTDGTVNPKDALEKAAKILVGYFKQIYDPVFEKKVERKKKREIDEVLSLTVEELGLPTRIANALIKGGYRNVGDITEGKREEISSVKNLGIKSLAIIERKLKKRGVSFKK